MIQGAERANEFQTWMLRGAGFLMMMFGTMMITSPIGHVVNYLRYIPLLGGIAASLINLGIFLAGLTVSIMGSLLVIGGGTSPDCSLSRTQRGGRETLSARTSCMWTVCPYIQGQKKFVTKRRTRLKCIAPARVGICFRTVLVPYSTRRRRLETHTSLLIYFPHICPYTHVDEYIIPVQAVTVCPPVMR